MAILSKYLGLILFGDLLLDSLEENHQDVLLIQYHHIKQLFYQHYYVAQLSGLHIELV